MLTLEPQIFWLKNKNRPYFAAAVLEPQLFFLWNWNCPYFSYCGDAAILVAEPVPLFFADFGEAAILVVEPGAGIIGKIL